MWEELKFLEDYIKEGDKILDLGCGNGRLYELLKNKPIEYYGIDNSEKLIEIAKNRYLRPVRKSSISNRAKASFQVVDALNLPFPENFFDKVVSVAVFHHIPSKDLRLQFLKEIKRVLRAGGSLILVNWSLNAWKRLSLVLKYAVLKVLGKSKLDFGDAFIPWQNTTLRYVHRFTKNEIKTLVETSGLKVLEIKISKRPKGKEGNILLIAEKH